MKRILAVYLAFLLLGAVLPWPLPAGAPQLLLSKVEAAQDFDGTNDQLACGSDATMDGFGNLSICFEVIHDVTAVTDAFVGKGDFNGSTITAGWSLATSSAVGDFILLARGRTTTSGIWRHGTALGTGVRRSFCVTHDDSNGNPAMYLDNVAQTITVVQTPSGTSVVDTTQNLLIGEDNSGTSDFDGAFQNIEIDNAIFTAAEVNQYHWTGSVGRPVKFRLKLYTGKLTQEGTATGSDCTATGTTSAARIPWGWRNPGISP